MRLVTVLLIALAPVPAFGADLPATKAPAAPVYTSSPWDGLYIGGAGGYAWNTTGFVGGENIIDAPHGPMGGVQVGADYMLGNSNFVIGARADLNLASITAVNGDASAKTNLFGTVDARLGYLLAPTLMVYGVGGLAYAQPRVLNNGLDVKETALGWNLGGGFEAKLPGSKWSTFLEAGYADVGSTAKLQMGYTRAGVNYRF